MIGGQGTWLVRMENIIVFCLKQFLKVKIELNLKSNLKDIFLVSYMVGTPPV